MIKKRLSILCLLCLISFAVADDDPVVDDGNDQPTDPLLDEEVNPAEPEVPVDEPKIEDPAEPAVPDEQPEPEPEHEEAPETEPVTAAEEPEVDETTEGELSTGPVTLDDIPEETTSAYRFDAKCSCFVKTILKRQSAEELLGEDLTESPKPEHCDKHGMDECIEYCNRNIKSKTNNFDLTKVPVTNSGVDVSLGQYICNQIGGHILPSRMTLYAKLTCTSTGPRHELSTSHLATTGVNSKQRLWCVRGKFRPM